MRDLLAPSFCEADISTGAPEEPIGWIRSRSKPHGSMFRDRVDAIIVHNVSVLPLLRLVDEVPKDAPTFAYVVWGPRYAFLWFE